MKKRNGLLSKVKKRIFWVIIALVFSAIACNFPKFGDTQTVVESPPPLKGPVIIFQEPAPGFRVAVNDSFTANAVAQDSTGVTRIELWVDDTVVLAKDSPDGSTSTFLSITYPMVAVRPGGYALVVRAYNQQGEMQESPVHYVVVYAVEATEQKLAQYRVAEGETIDQIAAKAGTTSDGIKKENPSVQKSGKVKAGQIILVPAPPKRAVPPAKAPGQQAPPPNVPHPNAPPPPANAGKGALVTINNQVFQPNPVYYGSNCGNKNPVNKVTITADIRPASEVKQATLFYAYRKNDGTWVSGISSLPLAIKGGNNFAADVTITPDLEQFLAKGDGYMTAWVEVVDSKGTKISNQNQGNTIRVIHCSSNIQVPPGVVPGALPGGGGANQNGGGNNNNADVFPDPGFAPPGSQSGAAAGFTAKPLGNCKVRLEWVDVNLGETNYFIARLDPGKPMQTYIAKMHPDRSSHEDRVPAPGKYIYTVIASKDGKALSQQLASVNVPATDTCKPKSDFMRVFFQPLRFQPKDSGLTSGFINVTFERMITFRIPRGQQTNYQIGHWSTEWARRVAPAPETVYTVPGGEFSLQVQGNGNANPAKLPPVALGQFGENLKILDLMKDDASTKVYKGSAPGFSLDYKLWIEPWVWNGEPSSSELPPPTNLKLQDQGDSHYLTWDYDPSIKKDKVDGFILYRQYLCPGEDTKMSYPLGINKDHQDAKLYKNEMPVACTCGYRVSAFGRGGESKMSAPQAGECKTSLGVSQLEVTFESLSIDPELLPVVGSGEIYLTANEFSRKTDTILLEGKKYNLNYVLLNGHENNNSTRLAYAKGEIPTLVVNFYVSNLCKGQSLHIERQTVDNLAGEYEVSSYDGLCKLKINVHKLRNQGENGMIAEKTAGTFCQDDFECESGKCENGMCAPDGKGPANSFCFSNSHCISGVCNCVETGLGNVFACPVVPGKGVSGYCSEGKANSEKCSSSSDCASGHCANGICAPKDGRGQKGDYCHHDNHCATGFCFCREGYSGKFCKTDASTQLPSHGICILPPGFQNGESCSANDDCMSNHCANGKCAPRDGTGTHGEYCHHNNHCISGSCICPSGIASFWTGGFCPDWENFNATDNHGTCAP